MDERIDREKIIKILNTKIYPRNNVDPAVAIADFFIDNDLVPVVRCKDCKRFKTYLCPMWFCNSHDDFCCYGERKEDE